MPKSLAVVGKSPMETIPATIQGEAPARVHLVARPVGYTTMWYDFEGQPANKWALYPKGLYSTPLQSYNAICDYNGGSC